MDGYSFIRDVMIAKAKYWSPYHSFSAPLLFLEAVPKIHLPLVPHVPEQFPGVAIQLTSTNIGRKCFIDQPIAVICDTRGPKKTLVLVRLNN